jgi:hypothetical protein
VEIFGIFPYAPCATSATFCVRSESHIAWGQALYGRVLFLQVFLSQKILAIVAADNSFYQSKVVR